MHRLLVETKLLNEDVPTLPPQAARHLKVLRPKEGEKIELFDGRGSWRFYVWRNGLSAVSRLSSPGAWLSAPAPRLPVTLFACVTKGSRWDWTIEKATELGVERIVPVISERTIVRIPKAERAAKRERWSRIAEDAARQSDAKWLPEIVEPVDFSDALSLVKATTCFVGALVEPPAEMLATAVGRALKAGETREMAVFVGPEGDFTRSELDELLKFAIPTSFGATILRSETAAIFAVSILAALYAAMAPGQEFSHP